MNAVGRRRPLILVPIGPLVMPLMLMACLVYYFAFASNLDMYDGDTGYFQLALNAHDHFVYVYGVDRVLDGDIGYEFANDLGIAAIYVFLAKLLPFLVDPNFTLLSLIFNCAALCVCYKVYSDISDRLKLGNIGRLSFFANIYFIYFAQLINKDMLTVLAFLLAVHSGMNRRYWPLLVLIPLFGLVRQQLVIFLLIFVFLMSREKPIRHIVWLYLLTALAAGILSVFASIIGEESLGDGFSAYLIEFNRHYYLGYVLFNPLRVIQYIIDAYSSFALQTPNGGIDTAKLLRLPQLVVLLLLIKPLSTLVTRFRHWLSEPTTRPLVLAVIAYLLAWLMNPTVNARYVMLITPVLVLFGLRVARDRRRVVR